MKNPKRKIIFWNRKSRIAMIFVLIVMTAVALWFIDRQELTVNFSVTYAIIELVLHVFLWFGLAFLSAIFVTKPRYKKTSSLIWWIWATLGAIITWCPVCWVTLMSMLWLVSFLSFLPRFGLEIKLFSLLLLLRSIDYSLRNFDTCSKNFFKWILPSRKKTLLSLWAFTGIVLIIAYFLTQAKWLKIPEYQIKMLFPDTYSAFWYDLSEGCSDTDTFREFYGQDRNFMLKNIKVFNIEWVRNFDKCSIENEYPNWEITSKVFQEMIDIRATTDKNTIQIDKRKYVYQNWNCNDTNKCNIKIRTVESWTLLIIDAKYKKDLKLNLDQYIYAELKKIHIKPL